MSCLEVSYREPIRRLSSVEGSCRLGVAGVRILVRLKWVFALSLDPYFHHSNGFSLLPISFLSLPIKAVTSLILASICLGGTVEL